MDIISFETAKRLKEAAFPHAEFETGQFLYNKQGEIAFLFDSGIVTRPLCPILFPSRKAMNPESSNDLLYCYFAPTATDILKELGPNWNLSSFMLPSGEVPFAVVWGYEHEEVADPDKEFYHDNPAEACAAAWLQLNEIKNEKPDTNTAYPVSNSVAGSVKNK